MEKLGWPTLFCNTLEVAPDGEITGFRMRCEQSKLTHGEGAQSIGYETIASGGQLQRPRHDPGQARRASCSRAPSRSKRPIPRCPPMRPSGSCWMRSRAFWTKRAAVEDAGRKGGQR